MLILFENLPALYVSAFLNAASQSSSLFNLLKTVAFNNSILPMRIRRKVVTLSSWSPGSVTKSKLIFAYRQLKDLESEIL